MNYRCRTFQLTPNGVNFAVSFALLFSGTLNAQVNPNLGALSFEPPVVSARYALDVPVDPRSVTMGESFVAVGGTTSAYIYNPAALATLRGLHFSYDHRDRTILSSADGKYRLFTASLHTSMGSIGVFYSRYNDELNFTGVSSVTSYDYVAGLTIARTLFEHVDVGITGKIFNWGMTFISSYEYKTNSPVLFDLGAQYGMNGFLEGSMVQDQIRCGLALQNFGTDLRLETMELGNPDQLQRLPRYVRIGFAYALHLAPEHEGGLHPLSFLLTAEYRNLLNGKDNQSSDRDFWGFGSEFSFFEIASVRFGGYISPATIYSGSQYGSRGAFAARYGFGLSLPVKYFLPHVPLAFSFDYAVIPLSNPYDNNHNRFNLFSIEAHLDQEIF